LGFTGGEELVKKDLIISNPNINEIQKAQEISDLKRSYAPTNILSLTGLFAGTSLYALYRNSNYQKKED
jgi:hypothetical protein